MNKPKYELLDIVYVDLNDLVNSSRYMGVHIKNPVKLQVIGISSKPKYGRSTEYKILADVGYTYKLSTCIYTPRCTYDTTAQIYTNVGEENIIEGSVEYDLQKR